MPTVVVAPQWQGSASPVAQRLTDGAREPAGLVPDTTLIRPRSSNGRASPAGACGTPASSRRTSPRSAGRSPPPATGPRSPSAATAASNPPRSSGPARGGRLAVVRFDAHGDLNTPGTAPSGGFHGMVLRALPGEAPDGLGPHPGGTLDPGHVVLAGPRALDPGEIDHIDRHRLRHLTVADLADPARPTGAAAATGAQAVYLHIDLDVLDPERGGLTPAALTAAVRALAERFTVAGLGITEYLPTRPGTGTLPPAPSPAPAPAVGAPPAPGPREP
nr:MAG: arginase [Actinomycetota bacterium]